MPNRCRPLLLLTPILTLWSVGCGGTGDLPGGPGDPGPSKVEVASGDAQVGIVGQQLTNEIVVRVLDADGAPVAGIAVTFAAASGDGGFIPAEAQTDPDGMTSATWTLGDAPGR